MTKMWDIGKTIDILGESSAVLGIIRGILTGCDTSTKLLGIGKGLASKKFAKSSIFKD